MYKGVKLSLGKYSTNKMEFFMAFAMKVQDSSANNVFPLQFFCLKTIYNHSLTAKTLFAPKASAEGACILSKMGYY